MGDSKRHTPGWNDPPSYSFEETAAAQQENRPKIYERLPARVSSTTQSNLEQNKTPVDYNVSDYNDPQQNSAVSALPSCDIPEDKRLSYVMTSFNDSILVCPLPEPKKLQILNRLLKLEYCWKEGQFTDIIKLKIIALTKAIKDRDFEQANKLQMALMVDHTRQCSSWIPAIRQLINPHL